LTGLARAAADTVRALFRAALVCLFEPLDSALGQVMGTLLNSSQCRLPLQSSPPSPPEEVGQELFSIAPIVTGVASAPSLVEDLPALASQILLAMTGGDGALDSVVSWPLATEL